MGATYIKLALLFLATTIFSPYAAARDAPDAKSCIEIESRGARPLSFTNNCEFSVEYLYCISPFDAGDTAAMCDTQGIRRTGPVLSGSTLAIFRDIREWPELSPGGASAGLLFKACDARNPKLRCAVAAKYPLLSVSQTADVEAGRVKPPPKHSDQGALPSRSSSTAGLTGPGTDSSMCQGDTATYGKYASVAFPKGSEFVNELDPDVNRRDVIAFADGAMARYADQALIADRVGDVEAARAYRKVVEFYQCHQLNNWPTVQWIFNAEKYCLRLTEKTDEGNRYVAVNRCIGGLAMQYHRLGR